MGISQLRLRVASAGLAPQAPANALRPSYAPPDAARSRDDLWLQRTSDGWALATREGQAVVRAAGRGGRVECMRRAVDLGVLRLR